MAPGDESRLIATMDDRFFRLSPMPREKIPLDPWSGVRFRHPKLSWDLKRQELVKTVPGKRLIWRDLTQLSSRPNKPGMKTTARPNDFGANILAGSWRFRWRGNLIHSFRWEQLGRTRRFWCIEEPPGQMKHMPSGVPKVYSVLQLQEQIEVHLLKQRGTNPFSLG